MKREAIILSDAFEALTNGMINDEILNELSGVSESSLLFPWKQFIQAVTAFYQSDMNLCLDLLKSIPEDAAPGEFQSVLRGLIKNQMIPAPWNNLAASIVEDNRELSDSLDLLSDSSESEDILLDTAGLLVREINREDHLTAVKIMVWTLEHLQETAILSDRAVTLVRNLFGDQEGYRLAALTSLSYDPDRSLVYWLHSLMAYLGQRNTHISTVKAYLNIIRDAAETVKLEFELTREYRQLLSSLISGLAKTLFHIYPEIPGSSVLADDPFQGISQLAGQTPVPRTTRQTRVSVQNAVQLELFAI